MKRVFFVLALTALACGPAAAVTAVWDHSDTFPNIDGYHIYWGNTPGSTGNSVTVAASACTPHPTYGGDCFVEIPSAQFAAGQTYYFAADAYQGSLSSGLTAPVQYVVPVPNGGGTGGTGETPTPPAAPHMIGIYNERP